MQNRTTQTKKTQTLNDSIIQKLRNSKQLDNSSTQAFPNSIIQQTQLSNIPKLTNSTTLQQTKTFKPRKTSRKKHLNNTTRTLRKQPQQLNNSNNTKNSELQTKPPALNIPAPPKKTQRFNNTKTQTLKNSNIQKLKHSSTQTFKNPKAKIFNGFKETQKQTRNNSKTQTFGDSKTQNLNYSIGSKNQKSNTQQRKHSQTEKDPKF